MAKQHGGKRKRAGRKPASDPKAGLTIYIEQSKIDANGGADECKEQMFLFLSERAEKKRRKRMEYNDLPCLCQADKNYELTK